ncbi:MAG: glycosyltransferase family 2 protein, partial [candidate division WOR-3 bacterium]
MKSFSSFIRNILIHLILIIVLFLLSDYYLKRFHMSWGTALVRGSVLVLLLFLVSLLVRYILILLLAFFQHTRFVNQNSSSDYTPYVSIIVPTYNEDKVIRQSLNSLLKLNYPAYEIIVVDDGSTDETFQKAKAYVGNYGKATVKLISTPNQGKARALNTGIKYAQGEIIVCMDGDSRLEPQSLKKGVQHFRNPKVGAVAGNVKVVNRNKLITRLQALEYIEGVNLPRRAQGILRLVNIVPGPIGFFRRKALEDVGYYSWDTFAEDCDLTLKLLAAGWRVEYEPLAISWTEAPEKWTDLLKQRYRWTRGILQSLAKHKDALFSPDKFSYFFILWWMVYEVLIWPGMNVFGNLLFIFIAFFFGLSPLLLFWWLLLTLLDIIAAFFSINSEREAAFLLPYSIFYRLFFILVIDVCKVLASIEEFLGVKMTWGKLVRMG